LESFAEHAALVALLRARPGNLTWRKLTAQVLSCGSAVEVWRKYHPDGLLPISTEGAFLADAEADLRAWERTGLQFISAIDVSFPPSMVGTANTPPFLFAQGSLKDHDPAIAVVGSRDASVRGIQLATAIAEYLVAQSLTVVSGLAAGIDFAVHETALRTGGRTVAFIATGITKSYPAANRATQHAIGERGLLLSQFWPEAPPQKTNFLLRNNSIAQYASAAIIVEAGEHSGARNLARHAVDLGRPLILTDLVTDANDWAQQLLSTSGVYRAASLTELAEVVQQVVPGTRREPDAGDPK
jgi:DNA processing protein